MGMKHALVCVHVYMCVFSHVQSTFMIKKRFQNWKYKLCSYQYKNDNNNNNNNDDGNNNNNNDNNKQSQKQTNKQTNKHT